ncbi:hypothetical protein GMMP15_1210008 [Candidatus Magnetomoraceae bacterium gMMP-15]
MHESRTFEVLSAASSLISIGFAFMATFDFIKLDQKALVIVIASAGAVLALLLKAVAARQKGKLRSLRIFISYAREDEEKAIEIGKKLNQAGFQPWMDIQNLKPGDNWIIAIEQAIKDADFFMPLISKNTIDKRGYLQKELKFAFDMITDYDNKHIVPVRLENTRIPDTLKPYQFIDINSPDGWDKFISKLRLG